MKGSPCLNCKNRYLGCHINCDEYKQYKKQIFNIKLVRLKDINPRSYAYRNYVNSYWNGKKAREIYN